MFLDIAKESADVFPPLKSCLGGVTALIKHYDVGSCLDNAPTPLTASYQQSKDVEDKLVDLIPWLTKLKDNATSATADGNHEEAKRREILTQCMAPSSF